MFIAVSRWFLIIAVLFSLGVPVSAAEGEADAERTKIGEGAGLPIVELDAQKQKLAGLEIMKVQSNAYQPEFAAYGKALNVQPLIAIRSQYRVALSEQMSTKARLTQSGQSIQRTEALYRHGAAAKRAVQEQQSFWQADKAQLEARRAQSDAVLEEAKVTWGTELAEWAFAADKDRIGQFVDGKAALILVTLPIGKELPALDAPVYVDPEGNRGRAESAAYISPAPQIDQTVQGPSYFFRTGGKRIRPGMTVSVWLPEGRAKESGVTVPQSALIWSMDQAFVYVKTGQDTFSRRLLANYTSIPGGYFVRDALKPGEEIVTIGGQMLLSEEFRAQIPDEND